MRKLVVYGLSNPTVIKLVEAIARAGGMHELLGFVRAPGDAPPLNILGKPLLGEADVLPRLLADENPVFFCNINRSPREMAEGDALLARHGCEVVNLVHPGVDLSHVALGRNVMIAEGCLVGPGTTIGNHVTCRLGAIVSHEVTLGNYVYLSPRATVCGDARLEDGCDIGAGATIAPGVAVGRNTIVGAGAVVMRDLPPGVTAVGVPARVIRTHEADDPRFLP